MDTAMIEVRDLVKSYGQTRALKGISFAVPKGQIVGFLGPNGAGKSTTMKILTGYLRPTAGEAFITGRGVHEDTLFTRGQVGYLPENTPLYDEMMVVEFLEFVAAVRQIPDAERARQLKSMVEVCGLGDVLGKDIGQLSKGFRQRVGLAQAMIHDPDILVLDEPTSGLDPNQIADIRGLVRELGQEKTLILSTHILPEVQATCDRVVIISDGALVADDTVEGLTAAAAGGRVRLVVAPRNGGPLDGAALVEAFEAVDGVRSVSLNDTDDETTLALTAFTAADEDPRRGLFEAAVAQDVALIELHREAVSLEETFRKLTAGNGGDHE
jgi:ABC-2 type transport system ATP-binding protein